MIVCSCHAVNDRTIRKTVEDGATTVREVGRRCSAGTDCGACRRQIKTIIDGVEATQVAMQSARQACSHPRLTLLPNHARHA